MAGVAVLLLATVALLGWFTFVSSRDRALGDMRDGTAAVASMMEQVDEAGRVSATQSFPLLADQLAAVLFSLPPLLLFLLARKTFVTGLMAGAAK